MQENIVRIVSEEPEPFEENGLQYIRVTKEISTPRKTYIKATITGKYYGNKLNIESEKEKQELFDFSIYEAEIFCNKGEDLRKNIPFEFPKDFFPEEKNIPKEISIFPREKLPPNLIVNYKTLEKNYSLNVLEPGLYNFQSIRKLHQTEGEEVFGTFNAYITGYVFDYEKEIVVEIIGPIEIFEPKPPEITSPEPKCHLTKTGKVETKTDYVRYEYICAIHKDKSWGDWIYTGNTKPPGNCLGELITIIGVLLGIIFFIAAFPSLLYLAGFYIIVLLIGWLAPYLKCIFRIIGIILLIGFFGASINAFTHQSHSYNPSPVVVDNRETIEPVNKENKELVDKWITRFRKWKDYDGKLYQGYYKIRLSDYRNSHSFKNSLNVNQNSINAYDEIVFNLKNNDKDKLDHVYPLFDSIGRVNKLNKIKFAEMVVSFVQDIPYTIILPEDCNPNLYDDAFTKEYLIKNKGLCDGNQRFGINTPIEFLAYLKGDCDTRTLLLYTLLSRYNYDVVLLSSEFYGHSLLGINLPYSGTTYNYNNNQKYVLWETTIPNAKPGELSNQISNINYWRISLKSK